MAVKNRRSETRRVGRSGSRVGSRSSGSSRKESKMAEASVAVVQEAQKQEKKRGRKPRNSNPMPKLDARDAEGQPVPLVDDEGNPIDRSDATAVASAKFASVPTNWDQKWSPFVKEDFDLTTNEKGERKDSALYYEWKAWRAEAKIKEWQKAKEHHLARAENIRTGTENIALKQKRAENTLSAFAKIKEELAQMGMSEEAISEMIRKQLGM